MNEDTAAITQREGEITFAAEDTAEDIAADSQSEGDNQNEGTQSAEGENTQTDKDTPFHDHPRWKQREDEWNTRFNDQEKRHQDDLRLIREEFGTQRKDNAEQSKIPAWFGGTQEQWDAYRTDRDAELKSAQDAAIERVKSEQQSSTKAQETAQKEATEYMDSEVGAIEADKTLNPTGAKIDRRALLKVVLDNELIDIKGRWNYRAGYKILSGTKAPEQKKPDNDEKKNVAAATSSESTGEKKDSKIATSDDFKGSKRLW